MTRIADDDEVSNVPGQGIVGDDGVGSNDSVVSVTVTTSGKSMLLGWLEGMEEAPFAPEIVMVKTLSDVPVPCPGKLSTVVVMAGSVMVIVSRWVPGADAEAECPEKAEIVTVNTPSDEKVGESLS